MAHRSCRLNHDHWHCAIWKRHEPVAHVAVVSNRTALSWCVSGLESTHDFSIDTGNGFSGGYQFTDSTWQSAERAMGVYYSGRACEATEEQQTAVFDSYEPGHRLAWPNTVPECGG